MLPEERFLRWIFGELDLTEEGERLQAIIERGRGIQGGVRGKITTSALRIGIYHCSLSRGFISKGQAFKRCCILFSSGLLGSMRNPGLGVQLIVTRKEV